ncbi:S-adenosylmethionine-diacylgycerolhomoserine-N-methyltransferase [Rhizobium sp. SG_E_25_P2]|uniref:class I SAM-dependent methyltransferase n=1 Tax=Rhizobium sp. SG_E_25_P2 TaxID=2879942 RepID=UPI002474EEEE|nr:class I SAM-dependent methyltransferase [Rhizobium sp. SG_E_25_P2]MDH6269215.1 S-adenosylmethionine-diacylgycerolhomoserine-N-methyltransferase [Rhizobium sp. SG_E_25_P2]
MTDQTLDRSSHSSLMDDIYRHQRHIYDLTRKYYLLGRDETIRGLTMTARQSLLEVGCGTGRNLVVAGRLFPGIRPFGLDISAEMLASAQKRLTIEGMPAPVLKLADATSFAPNEFGVAGFDRILISYALSMIPDWQQTIEQCVNALKPGGSLHVVDFGQQEGLPSPFRAVLFAWLGRFHVAPRAKLRMAMEKTAALHDCDFEFHPIKRGYAWRAIIRRTRG